jgi:hypothetical protein
MTGIIKKDPNQDNEQNRDYTTESEWFPIFRSGKYKQGNITNEKVNEAAEEFAMSGRRPPITLDHLTPEDFKPDAKPGPSAGNIVALRAVDSTDARYPGTRVLEARAKVSHRATWETREGGRRNVSAGFYNFTHPTDGKTRFALHHLALLGAAPPAVHGLPEVFFSEQNRAGSAEEVLFFGEGSGFELPIRESNPVSKQESKVETINFSEHEALLAKQEAELALAHSTEITSFKEQITVAEGKVKSFSEELEATKASIPVLVETARAEGVKVGEQTATEKLQVNFKAETERSEVVSFAEGLLKTGRINQKEFAPEGKPSLVDTILLMPVGPARDSYRELLSARPALTKEVVDEKPKNFRGEMPSGENMSPEAREQANVVEAKKRQKTGEFTNFREAIMAVRAERNEGGA